MSDHLTRNIESRRHFAPVHERLDEIEQMPPGVTRIAALAALRAGSVDAAAAVRMKVLNAGDIAWLQAQDMIDTHEMVDGIGNLPGIDDAQRVRSSVVEIAPALRISTVAADRHVELALYVGDRLPHAWVALSRGELSLTHVSAIADVTEHCPPHVTQAVEALIVPLAVDRGWTPPQIRHHARRAIIAIDPDGARDRAAKARKTDTDVDFYPGNDQMGTVRAHGCAATARAMFDTINARATQLSQAATDDRTAGQRRFDALAEFVLGQPASTTTDVPSSADPAQPASPAQQRARTNGEIQVRVDLATLLGLNDHPGELDGYGPITADLARELATDARWRRFVTEPTTGKCLDLGRSTYTPTTAVREFIQATYPTCQFIGCNRAARRCQIDHKTEWDRLGCTDCANLHPLCQFHHEEKTKKRWTLNQHPDGDTWTSPLGFTYRRKDSPYDTPTVDPPDPDYVEYPEHFHLIDAIDDPIPPSPDDPRDRSTPLPDEPPLDHDERDELVDVIDNSWGEFQTRAYNLLRAAQLIA